MGTAADNLTDYVYYPSEETIVSYLRWLESDGREGTNPPSAIKRMQVYSSGVTEASDFKESWMNDFPVGAYGDFRANWYATDLIYNSQGKGIRSTQRGGNWNLRTTSAFDDYNRKILSPQKEIEKNNFKVAFFKKQLQYRKGKEATPWKMIEYTIGEFRARFAICQIFPVQPIEPSQDDDVPLAAPAAGVPSPGPLLQEAQCSQDFSSYIRSQQTAFETISSVEGHQLQQPVSDLDSRQDMNHQEVHSGDNFTSRMDYFQLPDPFAENIDCWIRSPLISGYPHSPQEQILQVATHNRTLTKPPEVVSNPPMPVREDSGSQKRSETEEARSNSSQDPHLATKNDAEKESTGSDKRGEMPAAESHYTKNEEAAAAETEEGDSNTHRTLKQELQALQLLWLMKKKNLREEEEEASSEGPCYGEEVKKKYPLFFDLFPQKPHYQGLLPDGSSEGIKRALYTALWYNWVDLMEKALQPNLFSTSTHSDIKEMKQQAIDLEKLGFDVRHVRAWLEQRTPSIYDLNDARDRLHSAKKRKGNMEKKTEPEKRTRSCQV